MKNYIFLGLLVLLLAGYSKMREDHVIQKNEEVEEVSYRLSQVFRRTFLMHGTRSSDSPASQYIESLLAEAEREFGTEYINIIDNVAPPSITLSEFGSLLQRIENGEELSQEDFTSSALLCKNRLAALNVSLLGLTDYMAQHMELSVEYYIIDYLGKHLDDEVFNETEFHNG